MQDTEYEQAWGEDGTPNPQPTPERAKHLKKLQDEQSEFLDEFSKDGNGTADGK